MSQIRKDKTKNGVRYRAVVRYKGFYKSQCFFGKNAKEEAQIWANDLENQLRKGKYKPTKDEIVKPIVTVTDLIKEFQEKEAPKRYSKPEQYNVMYQWWIKKIGHLNISDVDVPLLVSCKNILESEAPDKPYKGHDKKSNSTVRKYLFALSSVLRYAVRSLHLLDRNPMSDVDKPQKQKGVVRFLSDEERKMLLESCKQHSEILFVFVLLAIYSGGRYTELLTLKYENIDFENEMIHFLDTKNNEPRGVPIYHRVMEMFKEYIEKNNIKSGYVFIDNKKGKLPYLKGAFEKVIKKCKINNFRFHDLRHTYASYLAQDGAELLEIALLLGHKTTEQVKVYAHLTKKRTAKVVRKMSANRFDFA